MNLKSVRVAIWTLANELTDSESECTPQEILECLTGVFISEEEAGRVNECDWAHPAASPCQTE